MLDLRRQNILSFLTIWNARQYSLKIYNVKGKLSRERYMGVTSDEKLSKSLLTFVNTLEFFIVFGKH